jgi:hypothetical protein
MAIGSRIKRERIFFSEEKKQKTFTFSAASTFPAMAGELPPAPNEKSFGSFLVTAQVGRICSIAPLPK